MGVTVFGAKHVEIANNTIRNTWGDCVYVTNSEPDGNTYVWSEDISHPRQRLLVHRAHGHRHHRRQARADRAQHASTGCPSTSSTSSPTGPTQGATDILFKDNTIGTYAHSDLYRSHVLSICGNASAPVTNVTVDNNVVTGGRQVNAQKLRRRRDRSSRPPEPHQHPVHEQPSTTPGPGYMLDFENVSTLTVTGNVQPLTSGQVRLHRQQHDVTYP